MSRPPLNFVPPALPSAQPERQHTERYIDGILMGNGFLITSQINIPIVYSVALFVFQSFAVRSCNSPWSGCFFPFRSHPRWETDSAKISRHIVSPNQSWNQMLCRLSSVKHQIPKSNIFSILTLKSLSWSKWSQCLNRASVRILLRTVKEPCFRSVQARFIFLHS